MGSDVVHPEVECMPVVAFGERQRIPEEVRVFRVAPVAVGVGAMGQVVTQTSEQADNEVPMLADGLAEVGRLEKRRPPFTQADGVGQADVLGRGQGLLAGRDGLTEPERPLGLRPDEPDLPRSRLLLHRQPARTRSGRYGRL